MIHGIIGFVLGVVATLITVAIWVIKKLDGLW
jgi:hypothetical protein